MTAAHSKSTNSHKHSSTNANHQEGTAVSASHSKSTTSHKHTSPNAHSNINPEEGVTMNIQSAQTATPVTSAPSPGTATTTTTTTTTPPPAKTPVTSLGAGLLPLPPDISTIPTPPQGYEPTKGANYRGIVPLTAELAILPKVLQDLARFAPTYATVLGSSAPPIDQVVAALTAGGQWSMVRAASAAWDAYCRDQEGSAWRFVKAMMVRLRPSFTLAVKGDATIATTYPSLAELISLKKANAQRAATARKKNKKANADGQPAAHGNAGKARQKKAAKAALAAAEAAAATKEPTPTPAPAPAVPVTPPTTTPPPPVTH